MLPGFRFLFAAIMLSLSLLVFGLGAAALLRAAHESFASNPSWRAAPEVALAQRSEATLPVLATLRVDTPMIDPAIMVKAPEPAPPTAISAVPAPVTSEKVAAPRPVDAPTAETTASETTTFQVAPPAAPPAENQPAATTALAGMTAPRDQTAVAAITTPDASSIASEPAMAQPQPAKPQPTAAFQETPDADQTGIAATRIATLGGPPVDIIEDPVKVTPSAREKTAKPDQAKNDPDTIKRRAQARRDLQRRRLAARARLAAQQQQLANPFAPLPTPAVAAPRR